MVYVPNRAKKEVFYGISGGFRCFSGAFKGVSWVLRVAPCVFQELSRVLRNIPVVLGKGVSFFVFQGPSRDLKSVTAVSGGFKGYTRLSLVFNEACIGILWDYTGSRGRSTGFKERYSGIPKDFNGF